MAPPKAVAKSLRKSAIRIAGVRRTAVAEAATYAVEQASVRGGSFFGGRARLTGEVVDKKDTSKRSSVLVYPKPAGAWAIKSYGRRESVGRPVVIIRGVGPRPRSRATGGDLRWPDLQDDVEDRFDELMDEQVIEALEG